MLQEHPGDPRDDPGTVGSYGGDGEGGHGGLLRIGACGWLRRMLPQMRRDRIWQCDRWVGAAGQRRRIGRLTRSIIGLLLVGVTLAGCDSGNGQSTSTSGSPSPEDPILEPSEPFTRATLTLRDPDGDEMRMPVYVAAEPEQRARGLMDRDDLPPGSGMIFIFPEPVSSSFYMYRTRIPLSIAFLGEDGGVLAVQDMEPCALEDPADCERYNPGLPYRYALEVNQGFFDEAGFDDSWIVELPADLPLPGEPGARPGG